MKKRGKTRDAVAQGIKRCEHDWDSYAGICNRCGAPVEVIGKSHESLRAEAEVVRQL